jgi:hypothetical protein
VIPLIGYAPDLDPTTPGVITECSQLVPFEGGMKGAPSLVSVGAAALAAACRGSAATSDLSGNRRLLAGTSTKLYELSGTTYSDVSRGANYSLGTDDRYSFAQFANATLAATPTAVLQRSTSGAFADVSGSPQAKIIVTSSNFAVAFNTNATADTWKCSAFLDETDWTLSVATQCVTGRLVEGSGPITAAARFGADIVAYKANTLFVGRYVGAPAVWQWTGIGTDVGCVGQEAVVDTGLGHVFVGRDNVYLFDGTVPRPLATGLIRRWLFADMSAVYQFKTICLWDRSNHLVWIYYASAGSTGDIDRAVVYHVLKQQWGVANNTIEAAVNYTSPTVTYTAGSPIVTTYDSGPAIPFDSLYWLSGSTAPAVFSSSHVLSTLSGATGAAYWISGDMGDDQGYSHCDAVRLRYTVKPTTSAVTGLYKDEEGDILTSGTAVSTSDGKHDVRQTARWHRFRTDTTGDFQVTGIRPSTKPAGGR